MKNYFQRQDIIEIQQIIQTRENRHKTSTPRWETDPQGISTNPNETITEVVQQQVDPQLEIAQQESTCELELVQP